MKNWKEITHGSRPTPEAGPIVTEWYRREGPTPEDLLYCLAHALSGTLTTEHLKNQDHQPG